MSVRDEFIAWLKTKEPHETYNFFDGKNCALAQFARHQHPDAFDVRGGSSRYFVYETAESKSKIIDVFPTGMHGYDVMAVYTNKNFSKLLADLENRSKYQQE
jgi:hypothetical protein